MIKFFSILTAVGVGLVTIADGLYSGPLDAFILFSCLTLFIGIGGIGVCLFAKGVRYMAEN